MNKISFFFIVLFVWIAHNTYSQEVQSVQISFIIKNAGMNVDGTFKKSHTTIHFSETMPLKEMSFNTTIDVKSISTGIQMRDQHLLKSDFFDVEAFPIISFKSTQVQEASKEAYAVKGLLRIKNVEKEVVLHVEYDHKTSSFQTSISLNRLDFGVGSNSWTMSDTVKVQILVELKK